MVLTTGSTLEVRRVVVEALSKQAKQKKLADLRQRWRTLTGSESPERWSEAKRTPIQWVLEGQAHQNFFVRYSNLHQLSQSEIDQMMAYLNDHATDLGVLQDHQYVMNRFVQVAVGDHANLVSQAGAAAKLQEHITAPCMAMFTNGPCG